MKDKSRINTIAIILLSAFLLIIICTSCHTRQIYIPVETVRTEYTDRLLHDSVYIYDSVFTKIKGDTVWFEKYKYIYKDKLVRDSVFKTDSIQVPYPVHITKEVNRLSSFQSFQLWCGRILLLAGLGWLGIKWVRKKV